MPRAVLIALACLITSPPAIAQALVLDTRTFHKQFVPPRPKTPLRLVFDELIESSRSWWVLAGDELDQEFERWEATLDPGLIAQLEAGALPEDADPNTPIFDNTWWPEGLADLGVPRPETLDERVRAPWEYANEMQRLIWDVQDPPPLPNDRWFWVQKLLDVGEAAHEQASRWLYSDDMSDMPAQDWHAFEERTKRITNQQDAIDRLSSYPELLERTDDTLVRTEEDIAWALERLLSHEDPAMYAVPVPITLFSQDGSWPPRQVMVSRSFGGLYLTGRARDLALAGDLEAAAEGFRAVSIIATAHAHVPNLFPRAVGAGIQQMNAQRAIDVLAGRTLTETDLENFHRAFRAYEPPPFSYAVRGERLLGLSMIDDAYAHARRSIPASEAFRRSVRELDASLTLACSRGTQHLLADIFYNAMIASTDESASEQDREHARAILDWIFSDEGDEEWGSRAHYIGLVIPAAGRAYRNDLLVDAYTNAVLTMIAIERYRLEHNALPPTLDDLPAHTKARAVDTVARDGRLLGYVIEGESAGFASGYRLYTVGEDREDNGGLEHEDPREALAPVVRGKGFDYVFNRGRE